MKASRRQELRTNDLAQYLEDMRDFFRSYGNYLAIGAVVIAAIVLVWFYQKRSTSEALTAAIKQMRTLPFSTDEEVRSSVKKLQQMATESKNEGLIVLTLRSRAEMAMSRAHAAEDGTPSTEFLDLAEAACKEVLDRFPDRSLDVGPALSILATIEEDRFVLDSDPAHKEDRQVTLSSGRFQPPRCRPRCGSRPPVCSALGLRPMVQLRTVAGPPQA
ncbi:MAG: hypothetical protein ACYS7M_06640 [Planctomycetota bacterium]|jgi:hypothetical protein